MTVPLTNQTRQAISDAYCAITNTLELTNDLELKSGAGHYRYPEGVEELLDSILRIEFGNARNYHQDPLTERAP